MGVMHPGYIISMESSNVKEKAVLAPFFWCPNKSTVQKGKQKHNVINRHHCNRDPELGSTTKNQNLAHAGQVDNIGY
jgi:hypothetical protein